MGLNFSVAILDSRNYWKKYMPSGGKLLFNLEFFTEPKIPQKYEGRLKIFYSHAKNII